MVNQPGAQNMACFNLRINHTIIVSLFVIVGGPTAVAQDFQTSFRLAGEPSELSHLTNGSIVTSAVDPQVVIRINGTSTVQFTPAYVDKGIYFKTCCGSSNNASYRFSGAQVGDLFNPAQPGQIR